MKKCCEDGKIERPHSSRPTLAQLALEGYDYFVLRLVQKLNHRLPSPHLTQVRPQITIFRHFGEAI